MDESITAPDNGPLASEEATTGASDHQVARSYTTIFMQQRIEEERGDGPRPMTYLR
jgi:hypothetical protein